MSSHLVTLINDRIAESPLGKGTLSGVAADAKQYLASEMEACASEAVTQCLADLVNDFPEVAFSVSVEVLVDIADGVALTEVEVGMITTPTTTNAYTAGLILMALGFELEAGVGTYIQRMENRFTVS